MFKLNKKEKLSIYHDSFYQHKKRKSPLKWLVLVVVTLILSVLYLRPTAASQFSKNDLLNGIGSGQLLFTSSSSHSVDKSSSNNKQENVSGNYQAALLLNSSASFEINGLIANVTLTQSFINQSDHKVNGIYAFPLPDRAAVNHLHIQIGDRIIKGKIMEKAQAKKVFEQAMQSGRKASLMQQHRPNLFTNNIVNIAAHEQITITIKYFQHIDYIDGKFSLRFPMKITPRYQVQSRENKSNAQDFDIEHQQAQKKLIDKSNIFPAILSAESKHQSNIHLAIKLNAGVDLVDISSPSHRIAIKNQKSETLLRKPFTSKQVMVIDVGNVQVAMDRDFILQWQPKPSNEPQLSAFRQKLNGEIYSLVMLIPPSKAEPDNTLATFARDITFIIDTSGSMQGQSIKQAKESLLFALQTLTGKDSFNIIAFESSFQQAFSSTVIANQQNIFTARQFISKLQADGGTEMFKPLSTALDMPTTRLQKSNAIKQIIFITDGAVSNELALFRLIHDTQEMPRLFTVGIGSAPNGYFMRKAAQFGRGSYTYIGKVDEVKTKMSALLEKISRPALRNIASQFQPLHLGSIEQYPKKIPDLYYGEPLTIAFKSSIMPNSIQVFGEQENKGWHQEVNIVNQQESIGITPIWAKAKIEDLLDGLVTGQPLEQVKKQVLATSLLHQVLSPYTSFIAVEQETITAKHHNNKQTMPFPATATGWQVPFIAGLLLLVLSLMMQARRAVSIAKKNTKKKVSNNAKSSVNSKC